MKKGIRNLWLLTVFLCLIWSTAVYGAEWKQNSHGWWYEFDDGSCYSGGFAQIDGKYYYFDENGYMGVGWIQAPAAGDWYYADSSGAILFDTLTPDGKYRLGPDGVWDGVTLNTGASTPAPVSQDRNTIKATIDGKESVFYIVHGGSTGSGNHTFQGYSLKEDGSLDAVLMLFIDADIAPGTTLESDKKRGTITYKKSYDSSDTYTAGRGGKGSYTMKVTVNESEGKHMKGTFSGTLEKKGRTDVKITDGSFDVYHDEKVESVARLTGDSKVTESTDTVNTGGTKNNTRSRSDSSYEDGRFCTYCDGLGNCADCWGEGYIDCSKCFDGRCMNCTGSGLVKVYAMGQIKERVCTYCRGTGLCKTCGGLGEKKCNRCNGGGKCKFCVGGIIR